MKYLLGLLLFFSNCYQLQAGFIINGQITLDSTWAPTVYISLIPSLEDMYTIAPEMIISSSALDESGNFTIEGDYLPKGDHLYRIHIHKVGDPPATLTIGGKEENHKFFIFNNESHCQLKEAGTGAGSLSLIAACRPNNLLEELEKFEQEFANPHLSGFPYGQELLRIAQNEGLRRFADTCSHPLVALMAIYRTDWESHLTENPSFYERLLGRWGSHSYWQSFRDSRTWPAPPKSPLGWQVGLFIAGILLGFAFKSILPYFQRIQAPSPMEDLQKLSLRERKIFSLIQQGKTNKEIAELTHVEVSTIKSHLRNIYAKLGISSRREAVDFPLQSKEE